MFYPFLVYKKGITSTEVLDVYKTWADKYHEDMAKVNPKSKFVVNFSCLFPLDVLLKLESFFICHHISGQS